MQKLLGVHFLLQEKMSREDTWKSILEKLLKPFSN